MAQATPKKQASAACIRTIIANQKKILKKQEDLPVIIGNQIKIIRNQQSILKNQKKILADHARHYRELSRRK